MLYACVLQQSFNMTFVRKIKRIVRKILKEKWEGGFKGLYGEV